jgi:hypothetical protein
MESRNQRIQYKKIAARLQKSELACRLHYHQLTKHRPSIEVEMYDTGYNEHNYMPRPSPSCVSNISPTPSYGEMGQLRLPSLTALFDDGNHRRSVSLPGSLPIPASHAQSQSTPPTYMLPPPRRLLSPFDETRTFVQSSPDMQSRLPVPVEQNPYFTHRRAFSLQDNFPTRGSLSGASSYVSGYETPRYPSPAMSAVGSEDRCSVTSMLNGQGAYSI